MCLKVKVLRNRADKLHQTVLCYSSMNVNYFSLECDEPPYTDVVYCQSRPERTLHVKGEKGKAPIMLIGCSPFLMLSLLYRIRMTMQTLKR